VLFREGDLNERLRKTMRFGIVLLTVHGEKPPTEVAKDQALPQPGKSLD